MLQQQQARQLAAAEINCLRNGPDDDDLIIVDRATIERPYAWIFFYTSKRWLETGDMRYAIAGNAPLFVAKADGRISTIGTAYGVDEMIDQYEEQNKIWSLRISAGIYKNARQLLILKSALHLTQQTLTHFKANSIITVAQGSYSRLDQLRQALNEKQVEAQVVLTS